MKTEDKIEGLVTDFSSVFTNFLKKTKNIYKEVLEETSCTRPQIELMKHLKCSGKSKMTDIGKDLLVSKPYVTALSDKLIEAELIYREHDAHDRRIILLDLTDKGHEFIDTHIKIMKKKLRERISRLSNEEISEMETMLSSMKKMTGSKLFDE